MNRSYSTIQQNRTTLTRRRSGGWMRLAVLPNRLLPDPSEEGYGYLGVDKICRLVHVSDQSRS